MRYFFFNTKILDFLGLWSGMNEASSWLYSCARVLRRSEQANSPAHPVPSLREEVSASTSALCASKNESTAGPLQKIWMLIFLQILLNGSPYAFTRIFTCYKSITSSGGGNQMQHKWLRIANSAGFGGRLWGHRMTSNDVSLSPVYWAPSVLCGSDAALECRLNGRQVSEWTFLWFANFWPQNARIHSIGNICSAEFQKMAEHLWVWSHLEGGLLHLHNPAMQSTQHWR